VSPGPVLHVIVDGANVVGSRPDGWWRDRPGAARRLAGRLTAALTGDPARLTAVLGRPIDPGAGEEVQIHLVLEGAASRVADLPTHPHLDVLHAPADGDAAIAALAADLAVAGDPVLVVTADRGLRERVRGTGAGTIGPGALLEALPG
jgi:hypothetical protein